MAQEVAIAPVSNASNLSYYSPLIIFVVLLIFLVYGITLFIKSRKVSSRTLKVGIYIPLLINFGLILFYIVLFLVRFIGGKDVFGFSSENWKNKAPSLRRYDFEIFD